jgi:imidazolonepropionase-like amidohydrolase
MRRLVLGLTLTALMAAPAWAERFAITGATVFDGTGAAPVQAVVVVNDGLIESVIPGTKAPRGVKTVSAKGLALVPGFFDVHTHFTPGGSPGFAPQIAAAYVASGVTTVNDFHQPPEAFATRREWEKSYPGPHVNLTARTSTQGGHGADWADQNTTRWINTPESAKQTIEELSVYKPDFIKAFADGWRYGSGVDNTSMNLPTLTALVEAAHSKGLRVGTHTVTVERGKIAAKAGVDIIAHALQDVPVDQEVIDLMVANKTNYAPTLAVYEPVKPGMREMPAAALATRTAKFQIALDNVKKLHDAGVNVVLGTDAGMTGTPHGSSTLREMELFVEAGMTPVEALVAGTSATAAAMGQTDRGTIAPGKRADIVLIKGKPWENIKDVRNTQTTYVDGKVMFGKGAPKAYEATTPPALALTSGLVADFQRADGRTNYNTLPVGNPDGGVDRSVQIMTVETAENGNRYFSITSNMARKPNASTEAVLFLTPGGIQPADASGFKSVKFDVRGDGAYRLGVAAVDTSWAAPFSATSAWTTVEIPFSALRPVREDDGEMTFSAKELLALRFTTQRPGGSTAWLEIDNVRFE